MKHGKKYNESAKLIDKAALYEPAEALELAVKSATAKFDETVEVTSVWALTPVTLTSRSAAQSSFPTEPAVPSESPFSLRCRRRRSSSRRRRSSRR